MTGNGDPIAVAAPTITVRIGPNGLEVQSNVPNLLHAIGMLELAKVGLLKQTEQGPPSRIIRL
jgi:hypothetical protein